MRHIILAIALAVTPITVCAQDWDKGTEAYEAGDYATALQEMRPLAEQGDALAQRSLGLMYRHGRGVDQEYTEAVRWWRLANSSHTVSLIDTVLHERKDYLSNRWFFPENRPKSR